ncbi:MAG: ribosome biogenesis GTPase Der [Acidobacteriota bacterium]
MSLCSVAIVGAPNVGKSTLFNRLTGSRRALVHRQPGMTRDRIAQITSLGRRQVELVDTGGILPDSREEMSRLVGGQARLALETAHLVLLVVDGRVGLTPTDQHLSDLARRCHRPTIIVVNKLDTLAAQAAAAEFFSLGQEHVLPISAAHALGIDELEEAIAFVLPASTGEGEEPDRLEISLALVGRPNVGKSSLLNRLLSTERSLVSTSPGTTRDPVDSRLEADGARFRLVDTAGLRHHPGAEMPESLAMEQTRRALARGQIAVLVMDASTGVTRGDLAVGSEVLAAGRAIVPVLNKWDLVPAGAGDLRRRSASEKLSFAPYKTLLATSARTGLGVSRILAEARRSYQDFTARRSTSSWNKALRHVVQHRRPPMVDGHPMQLHYAVQIDSSPPHLAIFASHGSRFPEPYRRYMENRLRRHMELLRTPIRLSLRDRRRPRRPRTGKVRA